MTSLRFVGATIETVISSFDIWDTALLFFEVYRTDGTTQLGDPPNTCRWSRLPHDGSWEVLPLVFAPSGVPGMPERLLRGAGLADLAQAVCDVPFE